jgi:DNA helicase II / ATP-dependent DNA helicase PcrA
LTLPIFELTKLSKESLILGDDDQSIYGFKDADPNAIISLHLDETIDNLDHEHNCYRCPDSIIDICTNLILKNKNRVEKPWKKTGKEGNLFIDQILTENEVNNELVKRIQPILDQGTDSILILSAVKFPLIKTINFLNERHIPIVDFIGTNILIDDLIKIWLLRSVYSENKILHLILYCIHLGLHTRKGFQKVILDGLNSNINHKSVIDQLIQLNKIIAPFDQYIIGKPTIETFLAEQPEYKNLIDHLDIEDFNKSLNTLTKELMPSPEFEKDKVNVMTIHKSKGLGADHVFILGVVQGVLPNSSLGLDTIEAQRRLLYVGMTRAKKSLHIISQVDWAGQFVNTVNKGEFKYNFRSKSYQGRMSKFIEESR